MDQNKIKEYLENLDEKASEYASKIIDNTIYITTNEMIEMIKRTFNKFKLTHSKYNLFIPPGKIGSDHYITLQLKNELQPEQIINDYTTSIENDYPIIMFDDAVYSSVHLCEFYDELTYERDPPLLNKFVAIVAVLSTREVEFLTGHNFANVDIMADITIPELMICNMFEEYDPDYCYDTFECETNKILPLIFEHKIANEFGSYQFYHQLLIKPIDRSCINVITQEDIDSFIEELRY